MPTTPSRLTMPPLRSGARVLAALLCMPLAAAAQSRGELLYRTHCLECHTEQRHWRQKQTVSDWPSLRAQVRFWQAQAKLGWDDDDVTSVVNYLNDTHYHLPPASDPKTAGPPPSALQGTTMHAAPAQRRSP
jgi:hypothetical protein